MTPLLVQCIYGDANVPHLNDVLIPALASASERPIHLACMNYSPHSEIRILSGSYDGVTVFDIENPSDINTGFAKSHNLVFTAMDPKDVFVLMNPDCIPNRCSIDALLERRKLHYGRAAIIEGRQWPFEHPKEYNPITFETPWASAAFALIDSDFYRQIGGMDEIYHMYVEDVDMSWQAWLNGYSVLYEPEATITHFTSGRFYRNDIISLEKYYSVRNFIVISRKFFGKRGERSAVQMLRDLSDQNLVSIATSDYEQNLKGFIAEKYTGKRHPMVKIRGINLFHETRW